MDILYKIRT